LTILPPHLTEFYYFFAITFALSHSSQPKNSVASDSEMTLTDFSVITGSYFNMPVLWKID